MSRRASWAALALALAVSGCRPREEVVDAGGASSGAAPSSSAGAAPARTTRILYPSAPGSFVDLVADARRKVVAIRAAAPVESGPAAMFPGAGDAAKDVALGTGFLVEARGVHVLTTDRIAAASTQLLVVLGDGTEAPATVVGRDPRLDVALLSIQVPRLEPLELGDSDELRVGEWVVALGNPFGDEVTASAGIVAATGRTGGGVLGPTPASRYRSYLQVDARIHRGNSGGPIVDTAGKVVGVAVATGDRPGEIGFAIPINRVKEVLGALKEYGLVARSWLGILVRPVTAEVAGQVGLAEPAGALVTEVRAGSPAAAAGLVAGDVVLRWQGQKVDPRTLPWKVAETPVGTRVAVTVWRAGAEKEVGVTTEKMPE